jgi:signal transduction histidine kinase
MREELFSALAQTIEKEAIMEYLVGEAVPPYGSGQESASDPWLGPGQAIEHGHVDLASHFRPLLDGTGFLIKIGLALWDVKTTAWIRHGAHDEPASLSLSSELPVTVLHHAAHAREAVLLTDPAADPRFSQDPYFRSTQNRSLAVMPILQGHDIPAILLFEVTNPSTVAHTQLRTLLAISAKMQSLSEQAASGRLLQTKLNEQATLLEKARAQLAAQAGRVRIAEIAANALHNVANLLTSVNTSIHVMSIKVRALPAYRLSELARLLNDPVVDLKTFFNPSGKGRLIPSYLSDLSQVLTSESDQIITELRRMRLSVDYISNIITVQQSYSRAGGTAETMAVCDVVDDAIRMQSASISRHGVQVLRDFGPVAPASLDKTRMLQILVNLVENATQAMKDAEGEHIVHVSVWQEADTLCISVRDNGCGITPANLERIFSHGFTTKTNGHGFGLHSCAIAAREMGGALSVNSAGPGKGATFILRLPLAGT